MIKGRRKSGDKGREGYRTWLSQLDESHSDREVLTLYSQLVLRERDKLAQARVAKWSGEAAVLVALAYGIGIYGSTYLAPVFAQIGLGFSGYEAGLMLLPGALASAKVTIARAPPHHDAAPAAMRDRAPQVEVRRTVHLGLDFLRLVAPGAAVGAGDFGHHDVPSKYSSTRRATLPTISLTAPVGPAMSLL